MSKEKNYRHYIIVNGEEWTSSQPADISSAYDEAVRMKAEYGADEAGVKVFTPGCFKIIDWEEGKYWRGKPSYLYKIVV